MLGITGARPDASHVVLPLWGTNPVDGALGAAEYPAVLRMTGAANAPGW